MESSSKAAAAWSVDLEDDTVRTPGPAETTTSSSPAPAATTRPYYECVFCKRGFTTAQALGGHMNIHRRDRDRLKQAPPARLLDVPATTKWYGHSAAYPPPQLQAASPMSRGSLPMLYYTGGAGAALFRGDADPAPLSPGTPSPRELTLFGAADDDHDPAALHLGLGWRAPERLAERRQDGEPAERKQLLDLELRLGPRPRH